MRRLIFLILAIMLSFADIMANDDVARERLLQDMKDYIQAGQYDKAKSVYTDNIEVLRDNGAYEIFTTYLYGCLLAREERYSEACDVLEQSISILDKNYEEVQRLKNIDLIVPYFHHAYLAEMAGRQEAEALYRKAKKAYEDCELTSNQQYTNICNKLIDYESGKEINEINSIISSITDYKHPSAKNKVRKCLEILNGIPNAPAQMYGILYQLNGRMAWYNGNINEAEDSYLKALKYLEPLISIDKKYEEQVLKLYTDLAAVYGAVKDYKNCASILQICKNYYEKTGNLGYEYARTLGNFAIASIGLGRRLEASIYLETAIDILSDIENINPDEIATIYSSASVCYNEMGNMDEAMDAALKAREYLTPNSSYATIAQVENNLGCMYLAKGETLDAQAEFEAAVQKVGHNPLSPQTRFNLACAMFINKDSNLNNTSVNNSQIIQEEALSSFLFLSEQQRLNYWDQTGGFLDGYNRFMYDSDSIKSAGYIYDNALFSKGLLLRTSNWLTSAIYADADNEDIVRLNKISAWRELISSGSLSSDSIGYYENLIAGMEKELLRGNIRYSDLKKNLTTTWKDISKALKKGEAAIEFIKLPIIRNNEFTLDQQYAAIIMRACMKKPEIIPLFIDYELDSLLVMPSQLERVSDETRRNELYRGYLYSNGRLNYRIGTKRQKINAIGDSLYDLVWSRIDPSVNECSTIYYSPISGLNSISFAALSKDSVSLGERYNLRLLSSTAEIVESRRKKQGNLQGAVYGGIKYDADSEALIAEARSYSMLSGNTGSRGISLAKGERGTWGFLEGTLSEATTIADRLSQIGISSKLFTDVAANEESFKNLSEHSPQLLHLATHGFFLSNPKDIETNAFLNAANAHVSKSSQVLNRSGLLFAGANRAWSGADLIDGIDDGILTAAEISNLNLGETELVVLSACETGLGVDGSSEGVFGLQRAFKLAGVKTIVMSLWKVPDAETSQLMQEFYSNWLSGMDRHEAFSKAQRTIKETSPNPYYWAGFVMLD